MPKYNVLGPFPHNGEIKDKGDEVELHPRQAKYHVLSGRLAPKAAAAKATIKPLTSSKKKKGGNK